MIPRLKLMDGSLVLRPFLQSDAPLLYAAVRESLADLKPWMSWATEQYSRQDAWNWAEAAIQHWDTGAYYGFVITDADSGVFLGSCSLSHTNTTYRLCNLGYWIRTSRRGQGLAVRAARLAARFAFEHLGLVRVEVVVGVGNTASLRVAQKAGAHYEGCLLNRMLVRNSVCDAIMFSFLPQDFGLPAPLDIEDNRENKRENKREDNGDNKRK